MIPSFSSPFSSADRAHRHVFIRDLDIQGRIGVNADERDRDQTIRVNLNLAVVEGTTPVDDNLENVVCYGQLAKNIKGIVTAGHINLVETLAERIAEMSLSDPRVRRARVRVEKPEAITDSLGAGVEIERIARDYDPR
ncbi:dihydroneopterin aldolase [Rhodospirillum sp. A1_3_36]|uniref:dihydroneopterin aldolase n=1 Tax=Rhodospirillum sp. A1_3_36 TaxID=3391666 RepID=UPI0039A73719